MLWPVADIVDGLNYPLGFLTRLKERLFGLILHFGRVQRREEGDERRGNSGLLTLRIRWKQADKVDAEEDKARLTIGRIHIEYRAYNRASIALGSPSALSGFKLPENSQSSCLELRPSEIMILR